MKILSQESNIETASSVSSATAVRIYNSDSSAGIVTRTDSSDNTIGDLTVPAGEVLYLEKKSTDKLLAPSTVLASKVAYSQMMYYASYSSGGGSYSDPSDPYTTNLLYHLDANNASSYGGTGDAWTDLVSGSKSVTLQNSPEYITAPGGGTSKAFDFNGINQYADMPSTSFALGSTFSIEIWARDDSDPLSDQAIFSNNDLVNIGGVANENNFQIHFKKVPMKRSGSTGINGFTSLPTTQTWFQFVMTFNSGTVNAYINKSQVVPNYSGMNSSFTKNNGFLARRYGDQGTPQYMDGQISIFRAYSQVLTSSQIETNYDAHKGRYGLS